MITLTEMMNFVWCDFTFMIEVPECFYVELEQFVSPALAQADCQGLNEPWNGKHN